MKKANALFIFSHVRTYGYTQLCKMNDENKKRRRLHFFFLARGLLCNIDIHLYLFMCQSMMYGRRRVVWLKAPHSYKKGIERAVSRVNQTVHGDISFFFSIFYYYQ